jgi:hypothetical protein
LLQNNNTPDMDTVAQAVDLLQRLYCFEEGLALELDKGHLLADVTVGVARALVCLGDVKSQKYAAEWLAKISEYVEIFESDGIKKVVETLGQAWQRKEEERPTKKQKS